MIDKSKIPPSWEVVRLGEVCVIFQGYGFPVSMQGKSKGKFPFYKVGDISRNVQAGNQYLEFCENYIDDEELQKLKAKPYPKNTIVFAKIGEALKLNRRVLTKHSCIVDNNAVGLKAIETICSDSFLFFLLKRIKLENYSRATTVPSVRKSDIEKLEIPLPPLPEQHRIVSKIEEFFSELDKGIESLKTARQQLKIYRQAVLKWAFEGRLTHDNVKDGELPEEWRKTKIVDVAAINPKLPYENIMDTLEVSFLPMKLVEEEKNQIHLTEFKKYSETKKGFTPMTNGDVIFAKITPCMENGKIAVVHSLKNNIAFGSTEFHVLRCKDNLRNYFLFYFLVQEKFRKEAEHNMTGAVGQRRVPKKFIEDSIIPVPPLYEQHQIVQEIETRLSVCDKLEETITTALQQGEALRQSILKKAFAGKLVAQNPEDEPATKLLERIKAEKAAEQQNVYKKSAPLTKQRYKIK